jgi:hypothetical protein
LDAQAASVEKDMRKKIWIRGTLTNIAFGNFERSREMTEKPQPMIIHRKKLKILAAAIKEWDLCKEGENIIIKGLQGTAVFPDTRRILISDNQDLRNLANQALVYKSYEW